MVKQTVTAFVIKRSEWLRGEGPGLSKLLRASDQKRCCVGIYARALGVSDEKICERAWPYIGRAWYHGEGPYWEVRQTEAEWLGPVLAGINDKQDMNENEREEGIAGIFANHGITVTFED